MNTWFISDLHLDHGLVAGKRSFLFSEAHDATVAQNWDAVVAEDDVVWVLGDITVSSNRHRLSDALDWIHDRPGTKRLIAGNHDVIHPHHRDSYTYLPVYLRPFESVASAARIKVAGRSVLLSHFPYPGTSEGTDPNGRPYDDRYLQWRLADLGMPLIHGHTHRNERITRSEKGSPQLHIGLDAWGLGPVLLEEAANEFLDAWPAFNYDGHCWIESCSCGGTEAHR